MHITRESTGKLSATIRISVEESDYQEKVDKTLHDHRKKANMPGFRPGMIPFGMIKRMYGKAVMAEEIQKLISESLEGYIKDNQLEILGQPLPNEEQSGRIDFETQTDFDFYFDIGLGPKIDLELNDQIETTYYTIEVDDKMLEDSVSDILRRHGNWVDKEVVEQEDTVKGEIVELGEDGEPKKDGIVHHQTTIAVNYIKNDPIREQFIGKSKEHLIIFNPLTSTGNANETAQMLGIKKEQAESLTSNFRFTVEQVQRLEPAQMNEELYQHLYPTEKITSEEEFRNRVRKDIARSMTSDSDQQFMNLAIQALIERANLELPDAFLKRYLLEVNDNKLNKDKIEKDYDKYARSLKWQLLENKLIREHQLQVTEDEIRDYVRGYFKNRFSEEHPSQTPEQEHGHEHEHEHEASSPPEEKDTSRYDSLVDYVMKNEEEVRKINDHLFDTKLRDLFKNKLKMNHKEVSMDEFIRISTEIKI